MAKIKKRKLSWNKSPSPQVVGYKLYWTEGEGVDYDANFVKLGNVTEVVLPDDVKALVDINGPIELGIAAIDEVGNESDLVTIKLPYQLKVPQAPSELRLDSQKEFHTVQASDSVQNKPELEPKASGQTGATDSRPEQSTPYPWGKVAPTSA